MTTSYGAPVRYVSTLAGVDDPMNSDDDVGELAVSRSDPKPRDTGMLLASMRMFSTTRAAPVACAVVVDVDTDSSEPNIARALPATPAADTPRRIRKIPKSKSSHRFINTTLVAQTR
jgi:hypothetical protein